ncbi:MAG: hypothetical protein D6793_06255 [Thermoflexia bacterium]|nr:MAG: hypothetical protein D6793_06255 [Thermoflexia bacterium]
MSKKARRRKSTRPRLSAAQLVRPEEGGKTPVVVAVPVSERRDTGPQKSLRELKEEYPYVVADLKRIGLIALAMLALLIGLAVLLV